MSKRLLGALGLALGAGLALSAPARAHDAILTPTSFDDVGSAFAQTATHQDATPWKGAINLTVTNPVNSTKSWGDFHFQFVSTGGAIDTIYFAEGGSLNPTSNSQTGLTWQIHPYSAGMGASIDLYFYNDPVDPGETANFIVYSDNTTAQVPMFGVLFYPTPVPEPATFGLLGLGTLLALRRRR